jgi:F420-0:gamma-glutamyl ligase
MVRRMMLTALEGIPSVMPGDDLAVLVVEACKRSDLALEDGDVVVLAQKIVSKSEGRSVELRDVVPSPRALELAAVAQKDPRVVELILREGAQPSAGTSLAGLNNSRCCSLIRCYGISERPFMASNNLGARFS